MISPEEFVIRWRNTKLAELDQQEDHTWGLSPLVRYDARKSPISSAVLHAVREETFGASMW